MNIPSESPRRVDRRTAIKWVATAAASASLLDSDSYSARPIPVSGERVAGGYGPDPDILRTYRPGELWPLTLDEEQRKTTVALCDVIIPADADGPAATAVGVPAFIDEWISAPYPAHDSDRRVIVEGLAFIEREARSRFGIGFSSASLAQQTEICAGLAQAGSRDSKPARGAQFFKRFRDLTAGGYYTTPEGMKDLGYVGNRPQASFDGPSADLLRRVGLA
jgi:hypothetical protein